MKKILAVAAIAASIAVSAQAQADEISTVACDRAAAEEIVAALLAEPSLQAGHGQSTAALVEEFISSKSCSPEVLGAELTKGATRLHPEGGVLVGLTKYGDRYAVVFDFAGGLL